MDPRAGTAHGHSLRNGRAPPTLARNPPDVSIVVHSAALDERRIHHAQGPHARSAADRHLVAVAGAIGRGAILPERTRRSGADLLDQPVVFFGSEGEIGVVAYDFADYLWLLAGGVGPMEAVEHGADEAKPHAAFTALAIQHAPGAKKTPSEVLARARGVYPTFSDGFMAQCRH